MQRVHVRTTRTNGYSYSYSYPHIRGYRSLWTASAARHCRISASNPGNLEGCIHRPLVVLQYRQVALYCAISMISSSPPNPPPSLIAGFYSSITREDNIYTAKYNRTYDRAQEARRKLPAMPCRMMQLPRVSIHHDNEHESHKRCSGRAWESGPNGRGIEAARAHAFLDCAARCACLHETRAGSLNSETYLPGFS